VLLKIVLLKNDGALPLPTHQPLPIAVILILHDGKTVHKLTIKDVPVDGSWSVSGHN
jgi:hypothetical protein